MFVLERGFREGWHGFVLSALTACSMFWVYATVWGRGLPEKPDP